MEGKVLKLRKEKKGGKERRRIASQQFSNVAGLGWLEERGVL